MGRAKVSNTLTLLALAAPVALGGCAMTSTYGTGQAPEMALFSEMTGGLLGKKEKAPIDYQARAPLVMPADAQLPQPVEAAAVADANWPDDPSQRKRTRADINYEDPESEVTQDDYRRLRPLSGVFASNATTTNSSNSDVAAERDEYYRFVHQTQGQSSTFKKALADANGTGRTERRYLTDPPTAYRLPTDTAPTGEIGNGVKKKGFWRRFFPG